MFGEAYEDFSVVGDSSVQFHRHIDIVVVKRDKMLIFWNQTKWV